MRDAYEAVAPDPANFGEFAARTEALVHEFPGWTGELRSLRLPTLLIFGDRDFSPLPDVVEMFELLPDAQLAVLPGTTHVGVHPVSKAGVTIPRELQVCGVPDLP
jgi:pimeloyl-ACP methyl ester carboxylesterase